VGVLYSYFRAPDAQAVHDLMAANDGMVIRADREPLVDAVGSKLEYAVTLGMLIAFARDVEWSPEILDDTFVWPSDSEEDEEYDGPWVVQLGDEARDTLAGIADDQMPGLSERWGQIEELAGSEPLAPDAMLPIMGKLVGLARRAHAAGDHLYCWICL
jgi:hypothetical protein